LRFLIAVPWPLEPALISTSREPRRRSWVHVLGNRLAHAMTHQL
jgi:hypothetical protein